MMKNQIILFMVKMKMKKKEYKKGDNISQHKYYIHLKNNSTILCINLLNKIYSILINFKKK